MAQSNRPLPYPAEELRKQILDDLLPVENNIERLLRFFRGQHWDAAILELLTVKILSLRISLAHLNPPTTTIEDPTQFDPPPPPAKTASLDNPTPPQSDAPSAAN